MYEHLLVALDGSTTAEQVLDHTQAMATAFGSRVTLIRATVSAEQLFAETTAPETRVEAKPDGVKAVTDVGTRIPDLKNDAVQLPDAEKPAVSNPDAATVAAPKRTGQIAVLISRKDSKLYVRQNFAPLFEVPITIAPSDRPLGTHVFTAQIDKNDANLLHWSVVSLPVAARNAERRDEDGGAVERGEFTLAVVGVSRAAGTMTGRFLDLFDTGGGSFSGFGLHPHSGIATLTYLLEGSIRYEDTTGATVFPPIASTLLSVACGSLTCT